MHRVIICAALVLLLVSAGCGEAPTAAAGAVSAGPTLPALATAAPTPVDALKGAGGEVWRADKNPWAGFAPGSWATYRLSDGSRERWVLERVEGQTLHVAIQVRKTAEQTDWEPLVLRKRLDAGRWELIEAVGQLAEGSPRTIQGKIGNTAHACTRVDGARQVAVVHAGVPGGVLLLARPEEQGKTLAVERQLVGFGVAR